MGFFCCVLPILVLGIFVNVNQIHGASVMTVSKFSVPKMEDAADMTFLDWNILAPIWVDKEYMKEEGFWDMPLLNDDARLKLIVTHILEYNADIVTLQEVQKDIYSTIKNKLEQTYTAAAFAPNVNEYWKEHLPKGVEYKENGVATFYKTDKFKKVANETFPLGTKGNIALATVVRPIRKEFVSELTGKGNPIVVINVHLEAGIAPTNSADRIDQGDVVINAAKDVSAALLKDFPKKKPVVIIAGDFNSFNPFPGFTNFVDQGYLDAMTVTGSVTPTFYYPQAIPLPNGNTFTGAAIDHVFVRESDVKDGLIQVVSVKTPDLNAEKLQKETKEPKEVEKEESGGFFSSFWNIKAVASIVDWFSGEPDFNSNINRALRVGSDHLSLYVNFKIEL